MWTSLNAHVQEYIWNEISFKNHQRMAKKQKRITYCCCFYGKKVMFWSPNTLASDQYTVEKFLPINLNGQNFKKYQSISIDTSFSIKWFSQNFFANNFNHL